jgi:zinc protease
MSRTLVRAAVLAAFLGAAVPAAAVDLAAPIPADAQVKVGKLPNGLSYYIQQNKLPAQRLELRLVVKAGSVLEDDDQRGLAHFAEHMAFNGSTHFKKHELVSYLQSIGVKFGADLNAYTTFDETVYILPIPTDRKENIAQAFTVLEDWAHGVSFNDADIDKERDIVLEELRLTKGAGERINKVLMPKLLNGSKYAERLPIGKEDIIRNFQPDTLRRFYRDWYRPDLMAVVAVGDIDPVEAEKLVKAHFADLRNPPGARVREQVEVKPRIDTEAVVVTDKELSANSVSLRYPVRLDAERGTYGSYRDKLVESLFGAMLNQRLGELSQQSEPPFMAAGSGITRLTPRYKGYYAGATLGPKGAAPAITALLQENLRAREYGFSEAELERARKNMLRRYERSYNERDKTNSSVRVAEYIRNFLHGEPLPGIDAEYRLVQEFAPGITVDEVNAFARRTIPADSAKLVVYTGVKRPDSKAPGAAELLAAVDSAEHGKVDARTEKLVAAKLMEHPPKAGSIVAETEDKALGLTRLTLSNGVKVILKPTDFRNDQVLMSAERFGGQTLFEVPDLPNAMYASALAATMGVGEFAPLDLGKILAGRSAGVGLALGKYTDNVSGSAGGSEADIETMLQMLYLRFAGVRRDENLYKSYMGKQAEVLKNRPGQPGERFSDTVLEALWGKHPYAPRALTLEDSARVSLDRSIELYRQRFASAKDLTFVLVGSFDVARIKPLLATYVGSLPTPDIPVAYRDVGLRPATGVIKREVRSGTDPKSMVSLTFSGAADWSADEALRLSALIEVINLRIVDVLREELGLIYGGRMSGSLNRVPYQHYTINAQLPTGPEKVDKLLAATFAEIARLKAEGPSAADLDKVKQNWRQAYPRSLRENGFWLRRLQSSVLDGTDPARILREDRSFEAFTPADLKLAAQRYFNTDNYVQVVQYPRVMPQQQVSSATGAGAQ